MLQLTEESTRREVSTESGALHYHEAGQGHPLVLLHGGGPGATAWSNFRPNIQVLAEKFRVLAVDMPGWGRSDSVSAEKRDHEKALLDFLDALSIENAALIGNSMGGSTSVMTAVEAPERVSHLIVMGAPTSESNLFSAAGTSEGMKILVEGFRNPSKESIRRLVEIMTYESDFASDELIEQRLAAVLSREDHVANYVQGIGIRRRMPTMQQLRELDVPTLIIHGRDDRVVHFEHSLRMVTNIPRAQLHIFNNCGHWAQLERADAFNSLVTSFLATESPTGA